MWLMTALFCIFLGAVQYHDLQVILFVIFNFFTDRNRSSLEHILRFPGALKQCEANAVVWEFAFQVQVLLPHLN